MSSVNKAILVGRLGKDPEYFASEKGSCLVMALATEYSYKRKDGEWENQTDWHNVKIFGKRADAIKSIFKKGDLINIIGRITIEKYQDKAGVDKIYPVILAQDIQMITKYKGNNSSVEHNQENPKTKAESFKAPTSAAMNDDVPGDDDLPF